MSPFILNLYKDALHFHNLYIDDKDLIYSKLTGVSEPDYRKINNENLVFPSKKQFDDPNQNKVYFHPLCESFIRGESEVIKTLRKVLHIRMNLAVSEIVGAIIRVVCSEKEHSTLTEEQSDVLKLGLKCDSTLINKWITACSKALQDGEGLVKIYIKNPGQLKGITYSRVGIVTFPFYKTLSGGSDKLNFRAKDIEDLKRIFKFVFPAIDEAEAYNFGTQTRVSPYFVTLMMTAVNIAERINAVVDLYSRWIDYPDYTRFNTDWYDILRNPDQLESEIRKTPELKGNQGTLPVEERKHPKQNVEQTSLVPPVIPQVDTRNTALSPVPQNTPPASVQNTNNNGTISFSSIAAVNPHVPSVFNNQPNAPQARNNSIPPGYQETFINGQYALIPIQQQPVHNHMNHNSFPQGHHQPVYNTASIPNFNNQPSWANSGIPVQTQHHGQYPPPPHGYRYVTQNGVLTVVPI